MQDFQKPSFAHVFIATLPLMLLLGLTHITLAEQEKPVETDARLHSNGAGWKLNQAKRDESKPLPRVLLIGDSILGGYGKYAVELLKDKAYVDLWTQPYHQGHMQGNYLTKMIAEVLAHGPYDVIAFNMGLHGWQEGRIPEGQFKPLTAKLVESLREGCPNAKLFWINTTQITEKDPRPWQERDKPRDKPMQVDPQLNPIIVNHNKMAAEVMTEQHVPIIDFYGTLLPHLEWAHGDQFHWKGPAYQLLAKTVVDAIGDKIPHSTAQ